MVLTRRATSSSTIPNLMSGPPPKPPPLHTPKPGRTHFSSVPRGEPGVRVEEFQGVG